VQYHDPHIPVVTPTREHANWTGVQSVAWNESLIRAFDCVVISTHHKAVDLTELVKWASLIVDTRNAFAKSAIATSAGQLVKA
jgi:UDP-N-acetyl-D-glucosamine dehydrogenase